MYDFSRPVGRTQPTGLTFRPEGDTLTLPAPQTSMAEPLKRKRSTLAAFRFRAGWPKKRSLIILLAGSILLVGAASASSYFALSSYNPPVTPSVVTPVHKHVALPPKPLIVPSTLTGLPVDPSVNNRTVTGVMIENSLDARPQSGLDQAGVVFEAVAEGGITRFLALFQDSQPDYIGPVRSARYYYIDWLLGFDAAYAHVGGSPEALADIPAWHVQDMNQFSNGGYYQRISTRYAPHNVYTSIQQLNALEAAKGYSSKYIGFAHKDKETPPNTPTVTSIDMSLSGYYYNPHFSYDLSSNTYLRSEAGAAHMELRKDGKQTQIAPKVVVVMVVPMHSGALDSSGAFYSEYSDIGNGKIFIFQDGGVQTGSWSKTDHNAQLTFTDDSGAPLKLDPGQTWITAINQSSDVTYK